MEANRDGTANVLEAASLQPPQRFVLVSSLAAGGPTTPGAPIDEARRPSPVTPYGQSKLAAEILVRAMPFPWTIVRPPTVYGEWDHEVLKVFKLARRGLDRKSTRLNSSHVSISYAVFCLKKKTTHNPNTH